MSDIFEDLMNFSALKNSNGVGFNKRVEEKTVNENTENMKPSDKLLLKIKNKGFNLGQMQNMLKTRGNQLVISCAGSGKTTSLIFKILYDIKTGYATRAVKTSTDATIRVPEKIWVSTFLKTGAEELANSLRKWQNQLGEVDISSAVTFSTLHAEFKRALAAMGINTTIVSAKDNSNYLKEVVRPLQLRNGNNKPLNSENYRDLESALAYTRGRLDPTRYSHDTYTELGIGPTIIDSILDSWKQKRKSAGVVDFEDLQEILFRECYVKQNEEVIQFLRERYNFIYIDEFQDTSQIQYALLKVYCMGCKQVVAVGDDDQTIYTWRGSDNKIITEKFAEDFNPIKNLLSVNYRCPSNILSAISPCIENNQGRFQKNLTSYKEGGTVRYLPALSYKTMVSNLSDLIYEDVKEGRSVAVLCRVNSDGLMPALILDKLNEISFSISGEGMTLDSYIGRMVLSIIKLFTEKNSPSVKRALNMLVWDEYGVNRLMKICKSNKVSIWTIEEDDLTYSCPEIAEHVLKWRAWRESMGEVATLKLVLQEYRVKIFQKDTQFNAVARSVIASVETLVDYFNYDFVQDFEMELEDINERLKARMKKGNTNVKITTVHEFKGKEADSVYVWNASEGVFPIKDAEDHVDTFEEERRVFYIANTRAKELNTLIYLKNKPSCFLAEMDLDDAVELGSTSGNIQGKIESEEAQEKALRLFEKNCLSEEDKKDVFLPTENSEIYEENEFWGRED